MPFAIRRFLGEMGLLAFACSFAHTTSLSIFSIRKFIYTHTHTSISYTHDLVRRFVCASSGFAAVAVATVELGSFQHSLQTRQCLMVLYWMVVAYILSSKKKESLHNEREKNAPSKNVKHFSDWFSCVFTVCVCCGAHWESCSKYIYIYIYIVSYHRILCVLSEFLVYVGNDSPKFLCAVILSAFGSCAELPSFLSLMCFFSFLFLLWFIFRRLLPSKATTFVHWDFLPFHTLAY